jgi:sarcosine oxidase subunit beta
MTFDGSSCQATTSIKAKTSVAALMDRGFEAVKRNARSRSRMVVVTSRWDCVVVGGGIVGCGVAWRLAEAGRSVVLFEVFDVAAGASGGVGLRGVRANTRDVAELGLARQATALWPELADMLGSPTGYARTGHLQLTERANASALREMAERQLASGIRSEVVDGTALRELEPLLSSLVRAALWCPDDGVADHTMTTRATADAARRLGADIRTAVEVVHIAPHRDDVAVRTSDEEEIVAHAVVVAAGAQTATLVAGFGVALPVFSVFPQVVITDPYDASPVRHLIGHAERPLAIKTLADRSLMVTGGRLGTPDRDGRHGVAQPAEVAANLADAVGVFPTIGGPTVRSAVADRAESVTPDLLPIIDRATDAPVWFATGWSGHGWAIAPAVSEALASWIVAGTRPPTLDRLGTR